MSQISYSNDLDRGQVGQMADIGQRRVESYVNVDKTAMQFGNGVAQGDDAEKNVRNFYQELSALTFSADLAADDIVNVSVNGVAILAVTYAVSHAATFAAVIAAIDLLDGVTAAAGAGRIVNIDRPVLVAEDSADILIVAAVTNGGSGTAAASMTYSTDQTYAGCVILKQNEDGEIEQYEDAGIITQGVIWGELVAAQSPAVDGSVYVVSKGSNRGKFSTVDDATTEAVLSCKFKSVARTNNGVLCAKIEFNRP